MPALPAHVSEVILVWAVTVTQCQISFQVPLGSSSIFKLRLSRLILGFSPALRLRVVAGRQLGLTIHISAVPTPATACGGMRHRKLVYNVINLIAPFTYRAIHPTATGPCPPKKILARMEEATAAAEPTVT